MAKTTTLDKLIALVDKLETPEEIIEAYQVFKNTATVKLQAIQQEAEAKASVIQEKIDKINGN